jgi:hypothetical protein
VGGDLGRAFYGGNARDALRALEALVPSVAGLPERTALARERLMAQLHEMLAEESDRMGALEELGGPETLVHGDLWPTNVFVLAPGEGPRVRLIDWDHVGVARLSYDLSTLLMRLPSAQRPEILVNGLFDSAERARIASHVLSPVLALLRGDTALRGWALDALPEVSGWFDELTDVLPPAQSAVA